MDNTENKPLFPLYIENRYCFDYEDLENVVSKVCKRHQEHTDCLEKMEKDLYYWLNPLISDGVFLHWLQAQSHEKAKKMLENKNIFKYVKDPEKTVRFILLSLGYM